MNLSKRQLSRWFGVPVAAITKADREARSNYDIERLLEPHTQHLGALDHRAFVRWVKIGCSRSSWQRMRLRPFT